MRRSRLNPLSFGATEWFSSTRDAAALFHALYDNSHPCHSMMKSYVLTNASEHQNALLILKRSILSPLVPSASSSSATSSEPSTTSSPPSPSSSISFESLPPPLFLREEFIFSLFLFPPRYFRINLFSHLRLLRIQILIACPPSVRTELAGNDSISSWRMAPSIRTEPSHVVRTELFVLYMS